MTHGAAPAHRAPCAFFRRCRTPHSSVPAGAVSNRPRGLPETEREPTLAIR